MIPGGLRNRAAGTYSLAAGRRAQANHTGSFVWADAQDADFASTANNQASFRTSGGVRFTSGAGGANQSVTWAPGSASWSFSSDRHLKAGIAKVDAQKILEKVARLAISEWNYEGYPQRHIGPMAQDFHAQFPLNDSDTTLNDADLHGVALAAIQGLNAQVKAKEDRIATLEEKLARLEQQLKQLTAAQEK
jgi:hypothetical protein